MSLHDAELQELEAAMKEHRKKQNVKSEKKERYLGHRTNRAFYVIILLLLVVIGILIYYHLIIVAELESRQSETLHQLSIAEAQVIKYKEAYDIVLEDAAAYSKFYDVNYTPEVEPEPENLSPTIIESTLDINSTTLWQQRIEKGIISDACIKTTKLIHSAGERVELRMSLSGVKRVKWPRLQVFLDGTLLTTFKVESEQERQYVLAVMMTRGPHYLDLIYPNGNKAGEVTIHELTIGDRTLETKLEVIDEGTLLGMFDCKDTHKGNTLDTIGAYRMKLEKE